MFYNYNGKQSSEERGIKSIDIKRTKSRNKNANQRESIWGSSIQSIDENMIKGIFPNAAKRIKCSGSPIKQKRRKKYIKQ